MTGISQNTRRLLHWIGSGLAVVGIGFVVVKLAQYRDQVDLGKLAGPDWLMLMLLVVVCGLSGILLALAWRALLQHQGVVISFQTAVRIYGVSQIAKYVPSNVVHLLGRQALASAEELPTWPVAKSTLWELGCLPYAALLCAPLALPLLDRAIAPWSAALLFAAVLLLGFGAAYRLAGAAVGRALTYQLVYLIISGVQFLIVLMLLVPSAVLAPMAAAICGAYVLAWVAGFLTPGAPAGVGVRELVLYLLLSHIVSQPDLLAAVVLARMVSVCGDVVFYFGAVSTRPRVNVDALS